MSSSGFAALCSAFGRYDVVHIHAEGPAFFAWLPKLLGKRVVVTIHGIDYIYGMFYRFGLIDMPDKVNGKMKRAGRQM